jgi:hypothetical protein
VSAMSDRIADPWGARTPYARAGARLETYALTCIWFSTRLAGSTFGTRTASRSCRGQRPRSASNPRAFSPEAMRLQKTQTHEYERKVQQ